MLRSWVAAIKGSTLPEIRHLIYFVGETPPDWWAEQTSGTNITAMVREEPPGLSIGHYHNLGAAQADTEWIMKLDVDTLPSVVYFGELLSMLVHAEPREWFNAGMFYMNKHYSTMMLKPTDLPMSVEAYQTVMRQSKSYSASSYLLPAATNFVCRRSTYLELGGCVDGFLGYGWEDYQQIYALEAYQLNADPLPGPITMVNVTQRCRDEISRRKARKLYERNPLLCLMHRWHPGSEDPTYRSHIDQNRKVLFDYINTHRRRIVK